MPRRNAVPKATVNHWLTRATDHIAEIRTMMRLSGEPDWKLVKDHLEYAHGALDALQSEIDEAL